MIELCCYIVIAIAGGLGAFFGGFGGVVAVVLGEIGVGLLAYEHFTN